MFSICLTLKVIPSKLEIIIVFKGPLKSFLIKMSNQSIYINIINDTNPEDS